MLELEDLLQEGNSGLSGKAANASWTVPGTSTTSLSSPAGRQSQPNHRETAILEGSNSDNSAVVPGFPDSFHTPQIHEVDSQQIRHTSGAVPLDSKFYIVRDTDEDFLQGSQAP